MAPLPVGVNTYSYTFSHTALDAMLHLADLGYRAFEILVTPPHLWVPDLDPRQRREIPRRLADRGLRIVSLNFPLLDNNLVSPTPEVRRYSVGVYRGLIELAGDWGVPYLVVIPGRVSAFFPAPADWLMRWFSEGVRELAAAAAAAGVQLLIENVSVAYLPRTPDVLAALERIGDPSIGVIYDVANAVFSGEDPRQGLRLAKDRLRLVHLSDTPTTVWRHDPVGRGVVDFPAVAETLQAIGYAGPSMFEIVSRTPDRDLVDSHRRLCGWGWAALDG